MKRTITLFLCLLAGASVGAAAGVPKKVPFTQYARLWIDSPFTTKPLANFGDAMKSPLDDYALCGVTQVTGGYSVILLDKKKPDQRIRIEPGSSPEYKIVEVIRKEGEPLGTSVRISYQGKEKVLEFDEKLLAIKTTIPPRQMNPNVVRPNQPPMPNTAGVSSPGASPVPTPRPRIVPPQSR